jgi:hypothetical protein
MQNRCTVGNHKQQSMWQVPLYTAVYNHQQQISSNKKQKYVKNNHMEKH